ncbi:hypothetical protein NDK47_13240 [Brevibacillus ruminantium]|uniref:Lipoprotein n=1 Tax=Brevibacillus ruminantium TaxID=2950604 RepID=A0ABY4WM63_9BACL|nr:hypothetical protein [Brevibacillus ruminantium]USG68182.1 hypothetical protein NDK47_13240 [Brevibacillus ruminantium]
MKGNVYAVVIAAAILAGCQDAEKEKAPEDANTQPVSTEGIDNQPQSEDSHQEAIMKAEPKVFLDDSFLSELSQNKIKGFDISIGASKKEVTEIYGRVSERDFYDGGQYLAFEHLSGAIFFFDGQHRVYAMDLAGFHLNTADIAEIRQTLGTPEDEGDSHVDGEWFLYYQAGENSVIFSAENGNAPVDRMRVINKKMVEESPQNL